MAETGLTQEAEQALARAPESELLRRSATSGTVAANTNADSGHKDADSAFDWADKLGRWLATTMQRAGHKFARLSEPAPVRLPIEAHDVQGLVFRGYGALRFGCYPLLQVRDRAAARAFLAELIDKIGRGAPVAREQAVQIAFSYRGLAELGLPDATLSGFSHEFIAGMTDDEHKSRFLGDQGESHPDSWQWGGPTNPRVDAVLMLFARSETRLNDLLANLRQSWAAGFDEVRLLETSEFQSREHFGFVDGISQPAIDGYHGASSDLHTIKPGEFLLGYPNEYGQYAERPLVEPSEDARGLLAQDVKQSWLRDFGRNGSYLVFRQLRQNVPAFRAKLDALSRNPDGTPNPQARERLAAQLVGRWPSGASLVHAPYFDDATRAKDNDFRYHEADPFGLKCPIGAHVRRANPRDALEPQPGSENSLAINRLHRLIRRGRSYGPALPEGQTDSQDRGLIFIAVNASIGRQFEFIQHSWLNDRHFNGLYSESDPLVGPDSENEFAIPGTPVGTRCTGLTRFVTVAGGGYFFMPGIRALRFLSEPKS
jgi:Dyp-type peroxidase family